MRSIVALLLLAAAARGDSLTTGTVTADTVVLRAAPKADAADTGSLFRGATVTVHHAEGDDWLAVQPPAGSISWINHLHVDEVDPTAPFPQNGTVAADGEMRMAAGKEGVPLPLDVRRARLPNGSVVVVLGPKVRTDDSTAWYKIKAPADDFRYLPRSAVKLTGPAGPGFVVSSPGTGSPTAGEPKPAAGAVGPSPNHPLWADAERAETAGQLDRAEELYFKLAREMNAAGGDPDLANLCYSRIHALRERRRQAGGTRDAGWSPAEKPRPAKTEEVPPSKSATRGEWTGAGVLRGAWRSGGRLYYALEDDRGRVMVYAIVGPGGVDLARYRGKTVDLYGPVTYPEGFEKTGLVTVERVDASR